MVNAVVYQYKPKHISVVLRYYTACLLIMWKYCV